MRHLEPRRVMLHLAVIERASLTRPTCHDWQAALAD